MININVNGSKATINLGLEAEELTWTAYGPTTTSGSSLDIDLTSYPYGLYSVVVNAIFYGVELERRFEDEIVHYPDFSFTRDEATDIWTGNQRYPEWGDPPLKGNRIWVDSPTQSLRISNHKGTPENPILFNASPDFLGVDSNDWGLRIDAGMEHCYFKGFKFRNSKSQTVVIKSDKNPNKDIHFFDFDIDGGGRAAGGCIFVENKGSAGMDGIFIHDGEVYNCNDEGLYLGMNVSPLYAPVTNAKYFRIYSHDNGNDGLQISRHSNSVVHSCRIENNGKKNTPGQRSAVNMGSDSENIQVFRNWIEGAPEGVQMHSGALGKGVYSFHSNYLKTNPNPVSVIYARYYASNNNAFAFEITNNTIIGEGNNEPIYIENENTKIADLWEGFNIMSGKVGYSGSIDISDIVDNSVYYDYNGWKFNGQAGHEATLPTITKPAESEYDKGFKDGIEFERNRIISKLVE